MIVLLFFMLHHAKHVGGWGRFVVSYQEQDKMWSLRFADGAQKLVDRDDLIKVADLFVVLLLGVVAGVWLKLRCGLRWWHTTTAFQAWRWWHSSLMALGSKLTLQKL